MKKIIEKVGIVIFIIVFIVFIITRIWCYIVVKRTYLAIENFKKEENRYYSVMVKSINHEVKEEILRRDGIVKFIENNKDNVVYEWRDFYNNQSYVIDMDGKNYYEDFMGLENKYYLLNLPKIIIQICSNFNLKVFLGLRYIIPIKYDGENCYKIFGKRSEMIVSKETYLPIYSTMKLINSKDNVSSTVEYFYEFKTGVVTDEDIALPDLTGFTKKDL